MLAASFAITTAHGGAIIPSSSIPAPKKAASFFGLTNVWTIHLEVSQADWNAMERSWPGLKFRGPAGPEGVRRMIPLGERLAPDPVMPPRLLEVAFPQTNASYVTARVEIAGQKFEKVGLRLKGHSSLMSSGGSLKRPFKIDFNRFEKGQKFLGLSKINLNNNAMDPSQMREALSYNIFRMAGVPASRTAFAKVYLSVRGVYDRHYLGLYTIVEQVDGNFLEERFGSKKGLLVKPESGLRYLGEDWAAYKRPYEAKNEPTPEEASRFIQFIKLLASSDEEYFRRHLEDFMDLDQFLRFIAVTVVIADMDSALSMGHNFYLFQRAQTKKIAWIPWDLNLSLGSGMGGEHGVELSIRKPAPGHNRVLEWILKDEKWYGLYKGHLQSILDSAFRPERVLRLVEQLRPALREPIALESSRSLEQFENALVGRGTNAYWGGPGFGLPLTKWLPARAQSIAAQLAGRSEGRPASMGGPVMVGGMVGGTAGRLVERFFRDSGSEADAKFSAPIFKATVGKWFQGWDADRSGVLSESEVIEGIGPLFGPPPEVLAQLPVRPRRGVGPETLFGARWFRRIDSDGNASVSRMEWEKAFHNWFGEWDLNNDGALEANELSHGLSRTLLMPPPPAFHGP